MFRRLFIPILFGALLFATGAMLRNGDSAPTTVPAYNVLADRTDGPVHYRHIVRTDPKLSLHIAEIDLTNPRVRVRVCPGGGDPDGEEGYWNTSLQTVRAIAQRERLVVAVNGNFFQCKDTRSIAGRKIPYFVGNWARASGLAMSDGRLWSSHDEGEGTILVDKAGRVRIGYFHHDDAALRDAQQMASGFGVLVSDGQLVPQVFDRDVAPRTAVGIDAQGKKLVMLVADGRRADYSVGLTSAQVSKEMIDLGCRWVLNLDGGGSSTMVMRSADESNEPKLLNRPSDGHDLPISMSFERAVACAVGVEIVEPKK